MRGAKASALNIATLATNANLRALIIIVSLLWLRFRLNWGQRTYGVLSRPLLGRHEIKLPFAPRLGCVTYAHSLGIDCLVKWRVPTPRVQAPLEVASASTSKFSMMPGRPTLLRPRSRASLRDDVGR